MTTKIKQEEDEDKAEEAIVFGKKSKKSPKLEIKQEVDKSILGTRDNNNNIAVKQEDDSDLNSRTSAGKKKEESVQKQNNYYESSHTQVSAINDFMEDIEENRPFVCNFCDKRFKRAHHLRRHVRIHTGERPYPCMYCPKTFSTSEGRSDHEPLHRGDRQYECKKCDAKFVLKARLSKHCLRRHPESTPYVCTYTNCENKYSRMHFLTQHLRWDHGMKTHKCVACSVAFRSTSKLKSHFKTKKHLRLSEQLQQQQNSESIPVEEEESVMKIFKCMTCSNVYKSRERLRKHKGRRGHWPGKKSTSNNNNITIQDNNSSQEQESHVQEKKFPVSSLQDKIKKEKVEEGTDYNNNYEHDTTTRRHTQLEPDLNLVKIEKEDTKVQEEIDESVLETRNGNNNNIALKHEQEDPDLSSRTPTGKKKEEKQTSAINTLIEVTEENRPHGCSFCKKRFKRATHLRRHIRIHTEERPYPCVYCPKAFSRSDGRNNHEQQHRGDRQYECQKCDAKFVTKISLRQHDQKRHPVSTPYVCTYDNCEKKYARRGFLTGHIKLRHGIKKHKCLTCAISFACPSELQRHLKTKKHLILSQQLNSESIPPEEEDVEIREIFKCMTCSNVYKTRERLRRHKRRREHWSAKRSSNNITAEDNNSNQKEGSHVQDENFTVASLRVKIKKEQMEQEIDCNNNNEHDISTTGQYTQLEPDLNLVKEEGENPKCLIKSFQCGVCLKSFGTNGRLENHQTRRQHDPHECPLCLQNFRTIDLLERHFLKHKSFASFN